VDPIDNGGGATIRGASGRVRKVSSAGIISTVARGGTENSVWAYSTDTDGLGDGGPATSALMWNPGALAVDNVGNLYIADTNNGRIRKVFPGLIPPIRIGNPNPSQFVPGLVIATVAAPAHVVESAFLPAPATRAMAGQRSTHNCLFP
jgi:hypothetical protein